MKALVFGSLNIDKVYSMPKLPEKAETLYCDGYEEHIGGKGLNQAVSLRRAGMDVYMAGCIGSDGKFLVDFLNSSGVNTDYIKVLPGGYTGCAVIEVEPHGQNQMILYRGANALIDEAFVDEVLSHFEEGDLLLIQYETSSVPYMINKAKEKGMITAFNPSPYVEEIRNLPLDKIDILILNEFEAQSLTGKRDIAEICSTLREKSGGKIVVTLGGEGSVYTDLDLGDKLINQPAFKVDAVDTTGAGDTFTGYFLASILSGKTPQQALTISTSASGLAVTKKGAAETIPDCEEVVNFYEAVSRKQ